MAREDPFNRQDWEALTDACRARYEQLAEFERDRGMPMDIWSQFKPLRERLQRAWQKVEYQAGENAE